MIPEAAPATPAFAAGSSASTLGASGIRRLEDALRFGWAVPREQLFFDALPIPAPLLNLVECAPVGIERVVGSVGHFGTRRSSLPEARERRTMMAAYLEEEDRL